ncbi:thiol-disulfide oxidoreductase [Leptospira hartskeerlii]|uniref:Thiol-disulfide oxidoreductase n=1 Tax=Leptospira hartskeerlii TaxID=2023177 RepID=A0A2M9X9Y7_9LEPT|nr:DCC1-like thiol-disulfide oxidoreductase family protein [Leptospira hartskeerlii]PJZ24506.1 thiol-disulfide oxidoreductase [Leptospira hartskeerlii]PJZ32882.1 thiol-disulfide oxidoreductase [Leptospira hartskeerlii]
MSEFTESIVLFDGVCNLCNGAVNVLLDLDKYKRLKFASLQSEYAKNLIQSKSLEEKIRRIDSILFWDGKEIHIKSNAIIEICGKVGGFWKILKLGYIIPKSLRNIVYDLIAKNRYRLFGKRESCRMPTPELKERILG